MGRQKGVCMGEPLVTIYRAATVQDAHLLRNRLEEEGIQAFIENAMLAQGAGVDVVGSPTDCRVCVAQGDADRALRVATEFEQATCEGCCCQHQPLPDDETPPAPVDVEAVWPVCPECGAARTAVCPYCESSSQCFPLTDDFDGSAGPDQPLRLLCPTCDEPHEARFASRCSHCGYRFSGQEEVAAPPDEPPPAPPLALYVAAALVILVPVGLIIWAMTVLR